MLVYVLMLFDFHTHDDTYTSMYVNPTVRHSEKGRIQDGLRRHIYPMAIYNSLFINLIVYLGFDLEAALSSLHIYIYIYKSI